MQDLFAPEELPEVSGTFQYMRCGLTSPLQFHPNVVALRHSWLHRWDKPMTTGRINQIAESLDKRDFLQKRFWHSWNSRNLWMQIWNLECPIPVRNLAQENKLSLSGTVKRQIGALLLVLSTFHFVQKQTRIYPL